MLLNIDLDQEAIMLSGFCEHCIQQAMQHRPFDAKCNILLKELSVIAQEPRAFVSKRKASDAASPAVAASTAAATDKAIAEVSPSKRIKADADAANVQVC